MTISAASANPSAAPSPISVHGDLTGLTADDHLQYALLAGRAGGQTLIGGTGAGETLGLQGSALSGTSRGDVLVRGRMRFTDLTDQDAPFGNQFPAILYDESLAVSSAASFIGIAGRGAWTINTNVFFYSMVEVISTYTQTTDPAFSTFLLFNATPQILRGAGNSFGATILRAGPILTQNATGVMTAVGSNNAVTYDAQFDTTVSGGTLNTGPIRGMNFGPSTDVAAGSTVNMGNMAAVLLGGIGGTVSGTRTISTYYGLQMIDIGNELPTVRSAAVYSESREATTTSNQRGLYTTGVPGVRAGRNEFVGGGTTIMHGTAWTPREVTLPAGQQDDVGLGWSGNADVTRAWVRVNAANGAPGTTTITGITVSFVRTGQLLCLTNLLALTFLVLNNLDVGSISPNRIRTAFTPGSGLPNIQLAEGQSAWMLYDDVTNQWRVIAHTGTYIP